MNPVNRLVKQLEDQGLTLAIAESITCGMASAKLASYKGASDVLVGSVVSFTPQVKKEILGVSQQLMDRYTCESKEVTEAMCKGLKRCMTADIYAAITGLASAGGSETKSKPVGTVFYHILIGRRSVNFKKVFRGTPLEIRTKASMMLYELILKETDRKR